jgi:hypothetical protein
MFDPSTTAGNTTKVTGLVPGPAVITATTANNVKATWTVMVQAATETTSGIVTRVTLNKDGPYSAGNPFDIVVGLTSVPASVKVDILRPDWKIDSFTARMEGLSAWITYTPPQEGTYTITATALTSTGAVGGTGTKSFVVSGGRGGSGSGSGGGCNGMGMGLLAFLLLPVVKGMKKRS